MVKGKPFQVLKPASDGAVNAEYFATENEAQASANQKTGSNIFKYGRRPNGYFEQIPVLSYWTYTGVAGGECHLLRHSTLELAEFHHNAAQSIGFFGNKLGITRKPVSEDEALKGLLGTFSKIEFIGTNKPPVIAGAIGGVA